MHTVYDYNTAFPGDAHGLAWEINQSYWGGDLASPQTIGHSESQFVPIPPRVLDWSIFM
jgi:hypothetical protein